MLQNWRKITLESITIFHQPPLLATGNNWFAATSAIKGEVTPVIISEVEPLKIGWIELAYALTYVVVAEVFYIKRLKPTENYYPTLHFHIVPWGILVPFSSFSFLRPVISLLWFTEEQLQLFSVNKSWSHCARSLDVVYQIFKVQDVGCCYVVLCSGERC